METRNRALVSLARWQYDHLVVIATDFPTYLQVVSTMIAATAAGLSAIAVKQAGRTQRESREARRQEQRARDEERLPLLLIEPMVTSPGAGSPTLGAAIRNAGGGVGSQVTVLLVTDDAYGRTSIGFLGPGEQAGFGSDIAATDESRPVIFARSPDGRAFVWDRDANRRELPKATEPHSFAEMFAAFYPGEDLEDRRPTILLRS